MKRFASKHFCACVFGCFLAVPLPCAGQSLSPLPSSNAADRQVDWKTLVPNILNDQKRMWMFPGKAVKGERWVPAVSVLAAAAGLAMLDPHEAGYFTGTGAYSGFNKIFSGNNTVIGTIVAPVSLYAIGFVRKDRKMTSTALFAGEAVGDAEILATVLKDVTKRARPVNIPVGGNYWDSWYDSEGSIARSNGSFPSGHTIAAFAIAAVVARRYRNHRWVPYAAYGAAALVGFSRLTLSEHFLSDVFMGGALGYSISRYVVLQQ